MSMKPVQIIATIGPVSKEQDIIQQMIQKGMSLARLNFSWGTHEEHRQFIVRIRQAASLLGVQVSIIQDLSGPRVQKETGHTYDESLAVLTDKDKHDLQVAKDSEVEYVAMSFVASADDIKCLREYLLAQGITAKIIAKIERKEALAKLSEIIASADGVMVARGDLGQVVPVEEVPFIKKAILKVAREQGKPSIVATGLLSSMTDSLEPSRADVSDITSAVLDGTSALMLSNETATGAHPVETVATMRKIADEALNHITQNNESRF
ncbi:hypothetical protein CL653_01830 [bacterium]|nr:hypothetical protein [bacterium]